MLNTKVAPSAAVALSCRANYRNAFGASQYEKIAKMCFMVFHHYVLPFVFPSSSLQTYLPYIINRNFPYLLSVLDIRNAYSFGLFRCEVPALHSL